MKYILFTILILASSYIGFSQNTQNIEDVAAKFRESVNAQNDQEVIRNGEILIHYIEENEFQFDSTVLEIRVYTARSYNRKGNYGVALELNLKSIELINKHWGKEHPYYATVVNDVAVIYSNLGESAKSLEFNLKALDVYEKIVGKEHPSYAVSLYNIAAVYSEMGDYAKSLEFNLKALEIREKTLGREHPDYAGSLNNIALVYSYIGDYAKSLEFNLKALVVLEKTLGKEHPSYATSLNNIALDYSYMGDYVKSLEYNLKALEIREKTLGKEHPDYATSLNNIAWDYSDMGDYVKSLEYNLKALVVLEKTLGKEHPDCAGSLNNVALVYSYIGDYAKSLEFNLKALEIFEKTLGKEHPSYALSLGNIALVYSNMGDYVKSLEYNLKALEIREKTLGKEHPDYAMSLNNIASDYSYMGGYAKSLEYSLKALEIREKTLGKEHPDYALSLNNIAAVYSEMGDYAKALEFDLKALEIREKTLGKEHPVYAGSLSNIALDYADMGDYVKSLEFNLKALEIREKTLGKEHPVYALSLNNIAAVYLEMGDYAKSLEYNLKALEIREKTLGKEHPSYALSLGNIALDYSYIGDYAKSLEYNLKALEIHEKTLGKEHPDYATNLYNIASNCSKMGDYAKSLEFNLKALEIREKTLGKEHPDYALSLGNIALDYTYIGDYAKSFEYNLKALEIREKTLGKEHPDYALSLNNIASNYSKMGDYAKSLEFYLKALTVCEKTLGKEHPSYAFGSLAIALYYSDMGDYAKCNEYLHRSYLTQEKSFARNKLGMNTDLLLKYKERLTLLFELNASFLGIGLDNISLVHRAWINLNGLIGSDAQRLEQRIVASGDPSLVQLQEELKLAKKQMGVFNELTIQEKEQRGIDQKKLEEEINSMERELSRKSQAFADFDRYFHTSDVTNNLSSDELFVDIARIPYYSFYTNERTDSVKYLVFISDGNDTIVDYLFIDYGKELENEIMSNYTSFSSGNNKTSDLKDELSCDYFWKPIAEKIGDAKTVYVSLGGVYNNINLNTLYNTETGKYLFEEKDIRIVNSARDFVLMKEREKKTCSNNSAVLFGYPNYDGNSIVSIDSLDYLATTRDLDPIWVDSLTRGGMTASLLPATKTEVENVGSTFGKYNWEVSTYLEDDATETNIKQLESPRVLHIATHGYFFQDVPNDLSNDRFMGMDRKQVVQNPMLRSGLLFTGANKTLKGEQAEGENGLLSAYEAALLDLSETELVVLSACETGRGEVKNSEGVYGLRKAISDAGAANTIMSLWKVDDEVTQEFMSTFYTEWLSGLTIREAFKKTQLTIKEKYPQPYYWGAFVLVGE